MEPADGVEQARLQMEAGLASIWPALSERGFPAVRSTQGTASGGPFAAATYHRGRLEVALIVRHPSGLGNPNYSAGEGYVGHDNLIWAIGRAGEEELIPVGEISFQARGGGDAFEALRSDLENLVLPVLDRGEPDFVQALRRAKEQLQQQRGW